MSRRVALTTRLRKVEDTVLFLTQSIGRGMGKGGGGCDELFRSSKIEKRTGGGGEAAKRRERGNGSVGDKDGVSGLCVRARKKGSRGDTVMS